MDGWMDGWIGGWMDGWMDGRMDGSMDGWDGRMDGVDLIIWVPIWMVSNLRGPLPFCEVRVSSMASAESYLGGQVGPILTSKTLDFGDLPDPPPEGTLLGAQI